LYNAAFSTELDASDLVGGDPIMKRIERKIGSEFDHRWPSTKLLRTKAEVFDSLSDNTRDRFQALFAKINATLG
jgi:hypothetical protein